MALSLLADAAKFILKSSGWEFIKHNSKLVVRVEKLTN